MEILGDINAWFWNEHFWLPPNITWNDISNTSTVNYAQFSELQNGFKMALVLLVVRFILEHFVFSPIGQYFGLKAKVNRKINYEKIENRVLEKAFCEHGGIDHKQINTDMNLTTAEKLPGGINSSLGVSCNKSMLKGFSSEYIKVQGLAKQLDWSERKVERWIRRRIAGEKPTTLNKFTETTWRFIFYLFVFCYGLYILWDKPWLWTISYCWYEYPHHSVTDDIWWYYMLELGFYTSLTVSQFTDAKRKDFLQMFVHHIATIMLIVVSWMLNYFRIGSLIMIVHDVADVPLELAKMAKYVEYQRVTDACFAVLIVVWIITRLGIFPFRIIFSALYEVYHIVPMSPAYWFFIKLLLILQALHIIWTWMIVKIAFRAMFSKKNGAEDIRSDSEKSISSSSENDAGS